MNRLLIFISSIFFTVGLSAQSVQLYEDFKRVSLTEGKVAFIKEIPVPEGTSRDDNFTVLKDWAVENYGKDPFISSVRVDPRSREIIAKSRIELVLPEDSQNTRERFVMRYRVNGYIYENRCVLEFTEISFLYQGVKEDRAKSLPKVIRAETFITDDAVAGNDGLKEIRTNTRKSTLYFVNQMAKDLEKTFGYSSK